MTLEDLKTIAAFGGLALGIFNLFISIYKDFIRKGKLHLLVEKADIKYVGDGIYEFHIDFIMTASGGDVFLKDVYMFNEEEVMADFGPGDAPNKVTIRKLASHVRDNLLNLTSEQLTSRGTEMLQNAFDVRGFKVTDRSLVSTSFVERLETFKHNNEWLKLPLQGWGFIVDYGNKSIKVPFTFKVHPSSLPNGFRV